VFAKHGTELWTHCWSYCTVLVQYSTVEMVLSNQPEVGCCGSGGLCGALAPLDKVSEDRREA